MLIDYGKRAYIKISELEKRVNKLEEKIEKSTYNTLFFDLTTPEKFTRFDKSVKFISNGDAVVKGEISISLPSNIYLNYQIKFQNIIVKSGMASAYESVITFDVGANDGENVLEIIISSSTEFEFSLIKITLGGKIDYFSQKRKLSLSTTGHSDYVIYQNGDFATLYLYSLNSLVKILDYNDVFDVSLLGFDGEKLYIAVVSSDNKLRFETLTKDGEHVLNDTSLVNNVSSVCGYLVENVVKVIFSKAGEIMTGNLINGSFNFEKTGRKGALVTADSDVVDCFVIYGDYKPTKFVDYSATYVLEKGENYHIVKTESGYLIFFKISDRLYKQEISSGVQKPSKLTPCDEMIRLYDGKYIKRVRDALMVGIEENV